MKKYTITWLKAAAVRAIKTVAQTFVGTIGASAIMSDVNWITVCSASLLAGIVSIATSLAGLPEVKQVDEEYLSDALEKYIEDTNNKLADSKDDTDKESEE